MAATDSGVSFRAIVIGFIAGALAVLVFNQIMAWLVTGRIPWSNWAPIPPFGVPALINATFWGGVWGVVFALVANTFPKGIGFLVAAAIFGAVFPTLAGWLLVPLIKGLPMGPRGVWYNGLLINGAWGLGTGVFYALLRRVKG